MSITLTKIQCGFALLSFRRGMLLLACTVMGCALSASSAYGQITAPRTLSASVDPFATLEEQLINRLRATSLEQRSYLRFVVRQVQEGRLEAKLVVAIERYALRRKPSFPFPFFERALRFEAGRLGVTLPSVRQFATTRQPFPGSP